MHNLLLIDKGDSSLQNFRKTLSKKGYRLINEHSVQKSLTHLKNGKIDLIAVESSFAAQAGRSNRFSLLAAYTPKIVLVKKEGFSGGNILYENAHSLSIREPFSFKEFDFLARKLLQNRDIENSNLLLRTELNTKNSELSLFSDISKMFNTSPELDRSMTTIMDKLKLMTGAGSWSLSFNDEPLFETVPLKTSKKIKKCKFNKGVGLIGLVLDKGIPIIIKDASKDKRFVEKVDSFQNLTIKSMTCAPLKIKNRVVGVLRLFNKNRNEVFTVHDMDLLINTATFFAMAIERAFLYQKIKHDDLTNLYNIVYFNDVVDMEIEKALRYNLHFSVLFMDIDNFKKVNDTFGHLVGSRVLIETAKLLKENLRKVDIIARYGGDEFVMILPQTSKQGSLMVAERLRKVIEKNEFLKNKGYSIRLTSSFGVASCPENGKNRETLLRNADAAMYDGKFSTKNIVFAAK